MSSGTEPREYALQRLKRILQPATFFLNSKISRLKRRIVGANVEALLVGTGQGLFLVDPQDMSVGASLIAKGAYGLDEIERIASLTSENSSVLFVGSHIGALVIPVSKRVKSVTAVEANPNTYKLLARNVLLNHCDNVQTLPLAASDQEGELEFILSTANTGGSKRVPIVKAQMYYHDKPKIVKVNANQLDVVVSGDFDLIVMDIEGSEYFALKGMQRLLSKAAYLIVEFIPHHLSNVSNVTVKEFLAPIEPHFDRLNIPSRGVTVERSQFLSALEELMSMNESDDGIVFSKS